jgi:3-deoxy-D-arabino-heptulosonate 7-phosphate (DAHP) synthase class II
MKDEALELLNEIEENINVCCAVTMDPDEVLDLIDKLREIIKENIKNG